jgi:hypothetical protein
MLKLLNFLEVAKSPESAGEFISELVQTYKPVVYGIFGEFFEMYKDLSGNDEYFAEVALSKEKLLCAYLEAGFTREEALLFLLDSELKKERVLAILREAPLSVHRDNG